VRMVLRSLESRGGLVKDFGDVHTFCLSCAGSFVMGGQDFVSLGFVGRRLSNG